MSPASGRCPHPSPAVNPSRTSPARRGAHPTGCAPCTRHRRAAWSSTVSTVRRKTQVAALIGRIDRRGRMLWSLPKGHIELGETAEQTAIREVAEETGIQGSVLAALGSIDYWFVTEGRRVHKTVHHYLMRFLGGELSDDDVEVSEVAWVPLKELPAPAGLRRRAQARRGRGRTDRQAAQRRACRVATAAPHLAAPARPDALAHPQPTSRRSRPTPAGPADERLRTRAVIARLGAAGGTPLASWGPTLASWGPTLASWGPRLLAVLALLILMPRPPWRPTRPQASPVRCRSCRCVSSA